MNRSLLFRILQYSLEYFSVSFTSIRGFLSEFLLQGILTIYIWSYFLILLFFITIRLQKPLAFLKSLSHSITLWQCRREKFISFRDNLYASYVLPSVESCILLKDFKKTWQSTLTLYRCKLLFSRSWRT